MSFCSSKNHQDKVVEVVATVASRSIVIDLISDDDDEGCVQERTEECVISTTDSSRTTTFTSQPPNNENNDQYEEQIITFQSILPQINRNDTRQYLIMARWNVEDAIHTALRHHHTTKDGNVTKNTNKRPRNNDTIHPSSTPQSDHSCITTTTTTTDAPFIDSDFPPTMSSIDGRVRNHSMGPNHSSTDHDPNHTITDTNSIVNPVRRTAVTKCHCGYMATPKQVQSDGPNYGRYYLCCGIPPPIRKQPPPPRLSPGRNTTPKNNTNVQPNPTPTLRCKDSGTAAKTALTEYTSSTGHDATTTGTQRILRNPYVKHPPESTSVPTTVAVTANTTTTSRGPCQFFQWDTTGVLGTINHHSNRHTNNESTTTSDTDGYQMNRSSSIRNHISWYRFSIDQRCTLYPSTRTRHGSTKTLPYKVDVSHIQQGMVGDCWFLSALTVVAEQSYLIERILPPYQPLQQMGCYDIHLFLDGLWQPIRIDSYLPVMYRPLGDHPTNRDTKSKTKKNINSRNGIPVQITKQSKPSLDVDDSSKPEIMSGRLDANQSKASYLAVPVFCATPDRILWPALIEKAYAKAHGSYQHLSGGFIAEGLQDLTGAPCETFLLGALPPMDIDMFWMKLISFHTAGFVMGVATYSGGDGLVGGHAYSILDVLDVPDAMVGEQSKVTDYFTTTNATFVPTNSTAPKLEHDNTKNLEDKSVSNERASIRLVRIRNPWGKREWKGDWSVSSEQWTRALRKRLGTDTTFAKGDGTFYMSFNDMLQRFHHLDVAKTQKVQRTEHCVFWQFQKAYICHSHLHSQIFVHF